MAISKRNTDPECKQKRAEEYRLFIKEKRNETLYSFFSAYSKFSILIFFALILLARWVSLEKFYIVFPLFLGLHLLILFLFPAYFSFLPAYGQTRDEKEGFSACTFLLGPSVFSLFYFYRYTSIGFWLITLAVSIVLFALLYKKKFNEVRYRISIIASCFGNCVFFGAPVLEALLPGFPEAIVFANAYAVAMNLLGWTVGSAIITKDKKYISLKKEFRPQEIRE
jgi:hypothetical protein